MRRREDRFGSFVPNLVQPGRYLGIDTRSNSSHSREKEEALICMQLNGGRSRYVPADRIWLHHSKNSSANSRYMYRNISKINTPKLQRDCRIKSPFKHWPQHSSNREGIIPEPGAALREEVMDNIKKYRQQITASEEQFAEKIPCKSKPVKQGRLLPLFGKPNSAEPTINQCIGIRPRPRLLGRLPQTFNSVETERKTSPKLRQLLVSAPATGQSQSSAAPPTSPRCITSAPVNNNINKQIVPQEEHIKEEPFQEGPILGWKESKNEGLNDDGYRVIHFAAYSPSSDYEDGLGMDQTFSIEIKKRSSFPSIGDGRESANICQDFSDDEFTRPED